MRRTAKPQAAWDWKALFFSATIRLTSANGSEAKKMYTSQNKCQNIDNISQQHNQTITNTFTDQFSRSAAIEQCNQSIQPINPNLVQKGRCGSRGGIMKPRTSQTQLTLMFIKYWLKQACASIELEMLRLEVNLFALDASKYDLRPLTWRKKHPWNQFVVITPRFSEK